MKKALIVLSTILLHTALAHAQQPPFYSLNFNKDPNLSFLNGAEQGPEGSGVSGQTEDRAYVAKASSIPTDPQPGATFQDVLFDDLPQVTITFWYKADEDLSGKTALLFSMAGVYLITDGKGGWVARLNGATDRPTRNWVRIDAEGPVGSWSVAGEWIFGAITWNSTTQTASVYQGNKTQGVMLQKAWVGMSVQGPLSAGTVGIIGNMGRARSNPPTPGDRPFSGSIDNISVFKSELAHTDIEALRAAALENKVP